MLKYAYCADLAAPGRTVGQPVLERVMNHRFAAPQTKLALASLLMVLLPTAFAATGPAQKPMLTAATGARPNVMITLDNSGSMAFPYHESYNIRSANKPDNRSYCSPSTGYPYGWDSSLSGNNRFIFGGTPNAYGWCYKIIGNTSNRAKSTVLGTSGDFVATWHAMRSADVNPIFYNPRFTYGKRVNPDGSVIPDNDNLKFISNQTEVNPTYCIQLSTNKVVYNFLGAKHNTLASCSKGHGGDFYDYGIDNGSNFPMVPVMREYTSTNASTPGFTWATCKQAEFDAQKEVGCLRKNITQIETITPTRTQPVTLPVGHQRTDCGGPNATTCSVQAEIENILNWYRYYPTRSHAVSTSIGQALASDLYKNSLRLGYYNINEWKKESYSANGNFIGIDNNEQRWRGVRLSNNAGNEPFYKWLYGLGAMPVGGTPLHNAVQKVAQYYSVHSDTTGSGWNQTTVTQNENPWAMDPSKPAHKVSNPELTCRRSFNILFSDGAWRGDSTTPNEEYDYPSSRVTVPNSSNTGTDLELFKGYQKDGYPTTASGRKLYTPFGNGKKGLSDLTARYFWHEDLRPNLPNQIVARPGQPTTWQNMATYTVGYLIRPTGELPGATSGLTFKQIEKYKLDYARFGGAATKPQWVTSVAANNTIADDQPRVDDFIQAGFTGGGAGFSVTTADDVRRTFDVILTDILNASGKDAGAAVAGSSSTPHTLEGRLKYTVSYKTVDNSGNLEAVLLDANGNDADAVWGAAESMPDPDKRQIFVLDEDSNTRQRLDYSTKLSQLPAALQQAINPDNSLPSSESFVRYILGDDAVTGPDGALYRQRISALGASVNSAPVIAGSRLNMGYGRDASSVPGKEAYIAYMSQKIQIPEMVYLAANDGLVHVINGADEGAGDQIFNGATPIEPGTEVAAFLPKSAMPKLRNFAKPGYQFEFLTDGPLTENDVWSGSEWRHIITGTSGRGGHSVFALNSPLNAGLRANRIPNKDDFLWEKSFANMGYMTNSVHMGMNDQNQAIALVNSGHYPSAGQQVGLYVLDANTGAQLKFIPLPAGYNSGIGLGGVTALLNSQRQIVGAYAGDAGGNLWRFKLTGPASSWGVSNNKPLFTTSPKRPIYAAPAWQAHPGRHGDACQAAGPGKCGTMVTFGTGILLDDDHLEDTNQQTIYGVWDNIGVGEADQPYKEGYTLVEQTIDLESETAGAGLSAGRTFYKVSTNLVDWTKNRGWFVRMNKLPDTVGERIIGEPFNLGSSVFFTSVIISNTRITEDSCVAAAGAVNVVYGLDNITGGLRRAFDQDGDGKADAFSVVYLPEGGFTRGSVVTTRSEKLNNLLDVNLKAGVGLATQGDIDLLPRIKATGDSGFVTGIGGSLGLFDGQSNQGWRRTWRPIQNLPETLR